MKEFCFKKSEAYIIMIFCIIPICICIFFSYDLIYGFVASILISSLVAIKKGYGIKVIGNMVFKGIRECKSLYLLILLIGANVSLWLSSGVVPAIIYYGLQYMQGMNFLFIAFLLVAVSSIFMGTAVGTISTIGLALLGIGKGFGVPAHVLVGTIVSGAFIADKISPISGLLNLTLVSTDTKYKDTLRTMLITIIPTILITSVIYYFIGNNYGNIVTGNHNINELVLSIDDTFYISPYLLAIPLIIVLLCVSGVKAINSILVGALASITISIVFQKVDIVELLKYILLGYQINTSSALLNDILISGGVISMVSVVLVVMGAIALSSILEGIGIIKCIMEEFIRSIKDRFQLIFKTASISSILTLVTCDQTLGIVLVGRLLKDKYRELEVNRGVMARTISDSGTIIAPLIPWNVNAIIITTVTGIGCVQYFPYAILCFICPIIMMINLLGKENINININEDI